MKKTYREIIKEWKASPDRGDTNVLISMLEDNDAADGKFPLTKGLYRRATRMRGKMRETKRTAQLA